IPFCFFVFYKDNLPQPSSFSPAILFAASSTRFILSVERRLRIHEMAFEKIKVANPVVEMDGEARLLFLLISDPSPLPGSTSFSHVCWFPHR
ncbi:hypothetical protein BHE74_00033796, partial [Ensete ventricosum]